MLKLCRNVGTRTNKEKWALGKELHLVLSAGFNLLNEAARTELSVSPKRKVCSGYILVPMTERTLEASLGTPTSMVNFCLGGKEEG